MTRIGGLPTARGLLRKCRARARPIANVRIVGLSSLFVNVRKRAPEVSRRTPFARIRRRLDARTESQGVTVLIARTALALVKLVRFERLAIRETCLWLVVSPSSGGRAVGRAGGRHARPERRACRPLYDLFEPFGPCKARESCNPAASGKPRGAGKSSFRDGPRDG